MKVRILLPVQSCIGFSSGVLHGGFRFFGSVFGLSGFHVNYIHIFSSGHVSGSVHARSHTGFQHDMLASGSSASFVGHCQQEDRQIISVFTCLSPFMRVASFLSSGHPRGQDGRASMPGQPPHRESRSLQHATCQLPHEMPARVHVETGMRHGEHAWGGCLAL